MESDNPTFEEIDAIAAARRSKSEEENKTAKENNDRAEEEERRRNEIAKKIADSKNDDMLDSFFRDMQNGTLHDTVDISGASGPLDIDGDENADSEKNTDDSDTANNGNSDNSDN